MVTIENDASVRSWVFLWDDPGFAAPDDFVMLLVEDDNGHPYAITYGGAQAIFWTAERNMEHAKKDCKPWMELT